MASPSPLLEPKEEWDYLDPARRSLYKDVMMDSYGNLVSLDVLNRNKSEEPTVKEEIEEDIDPPGVIVTRIKSEIDQDPIGFQQKVWPRLKVSLPTSRSGLKVCHPTSIFGSKACVVQSQDPDQKSCLPASRSGSPVCPQFLDCSSCQM